MKLPMLYSRQKLLLALLQAFGGNLNNVNLQKYLFLFTETCQFEKSYEFVPYRFGCFSFQSYADRRKLIELGILDNVDSWSLSSTDTDYVALLGTTDQKKVKLFHEKYRSLGGDKLVQEVYRRFPYFATRSEIAKKLMTEKELRAIADARPTASDKALFTIGYEGQSFENYLNRLIRNNVRILCDVRKNSLSRKYGFSKKTLSETLGKLNIDYVHMPELGIISDKRQKLISEADYQRLFAEYEETTLRENAQALEKLMKIIDANRRVAITCFEAEHCRCHRGRVSAAISKRPDCEFNVIHI